MSSKNRKDDAESTFYDNLYETLFFCLSASYGVAKRSILSKDVQKGFFDGSPLEKSYKN